MNLFSNRLVMSGLLATLLVVGGCSDKDDPVSPVEEEVGGSLPDTVTYLTNMKSLFDSRCTSCHATTRSGSARNGAPAGVNFDTYTLARTNAVRGNTRVQAGTMPPTGSLPQSERARFQKWLDQGLLE